MLLHPLMLCIGLMLCVLLFSGLSSLVVQPISSSCHSCLASGLLWFTTQSRTTCRLRPSRAASLAVCSTRVPWTRPRWRRRAESCSYSSITLAWQGSLGSIILSTLQRQRGSRFTCARHLSTSTVTLQRKYSLVSILYLGFSHLA